MPNFGIPSYAERLMASERILTKNDPDFLQLEAIKEQTTVTKPVSYTHLRAHET